MGLLKDTHDGKEVSPENDPEEEEKKYEKMFLKMGRDFITKEDFVAIMNRFVAKLTEGNQFLGQRLKSVNFSQDSNARAKAAIYKEYIEKEKDNLIFTIFDLAKIEESEEEEDE